VGSKVYVCMSIDRHETRSREPKCISAFLFLHFKGCKRWNISPKSRDNYRPEIMEQRPPDNLLVCVIGIAVQEKGPRRLAVAKKKKQK